MIATLITALTLATSTLTTLPDTGRVNALIPLRDVDRFDTALVEHADTPQTPLIEYSDAYATRLAIHRYASYAMLPLLEREVVNRRKWCRFEEMADFYAMSQLVPGVVAINTAMLIGHRLRGFAGTVAALFRGSRRRVPCE